MTDYIGNAREQNRKYDLAIEKIKQLRGFYQNSIDELNSNIKNVASVDKLKNSLTLKKDELDRIIKDINSAQSTITWKANVLQKEEEERQKQAKLEEQSN